MKAKYRKQYLWLKRGNNITKRFWKENKVISIKRQSNTKNTNNNTKNKKHYNQNYYKYFNNKY